MTDIKPLLFGGTLLDRRGDAVEGAIVQLWQADPDGNYLHPNPGAIACPRSDEHAAVVSEFQYFGTDATDSNGKFEFLTYRPGIYPIRPYSHFHFVVWPGGQPATGDDGEHDPPPALVTQFYLRDESPPFPDVLQLEVTGVDPDVYGFAGYVNGTVVVDVGSSSVLGGSALLPTSPTQPKGPFYPESDFFSMDNDLTTMTADVAPSATAAPSVPWNEGTAPPTLPTESTLSGGTGTAAPSTSPAAAPEPPAHSDGDDYELPWTAAPIPDPISASIPPPTAPLGNSVIISTVPPSAGPTAAAPLSGGETLPWESLPAPAESSPAAVWDFAVCGSLWLTACFFLICWSSLKG